jgi:prolyl oligopeptidase
LVALSPGGSDASTTREFDMVEKRFIAADEGGFVRPVAKGSLTWIDDDTVYVMHDFGPDSLTTSGYARTVRRWKRGTPIEEAEVVFEGETTDVVVGAYVATLPGYRHHVFVRMIDFYSARSSVIRNGEGDPVEIDVPLHAEADPHERWLIIKPREDWTVGGTTYAAGSLLVADLDAYLAGDRSLTVLFEPTPTTSLSNYAWTRNYLLLTTQEHVRDRIEVLTPADGWSRRWLAGLPDVWSIGGGGMDSDETDECLLQGNDFVTPLTLFYTTIDAHDQQPPEVLRTSPARFDASGLGITQNFATSADGTKVPYFVVGPKDGQSGPAPTLVGGYGGFEISNTAAYSALIGREWLAAGGTYVLANIRGGGEYGPNWHRAGLRENRHRVYEDYEAVARDLIARGITTPQQLGTTGGSNGGLLVGNMYVRSPELFGAIVCQVPLLDMKRYSHLLAGASWMAEYGDPDTDDWEFIKTFSPYHLIEADRRYPPMLLTTSTRDDRVHPGHARKMAARLNKLGHDVTYWENIEGGHGGAADAPQQATMHALAFTFLRRHLF